MKWNQLKVLVSHLCLIAAVVEYWHLTQGVTGSSPSPIMKIFLSLNSVKTFKENSNTLTHHYIQLFLYIFVRTFTFQSSQY